MTPTRPLPSRRLRGALSVAALSVALAVALAGCAGAPSRASTVPDVADSSRSCPAAVVVLAAQVFVVDAEGADAIATDDAPAEVRAEVSSCAAETVLEAYVEDQPDARSLAERIARAAEPVYLRRAVVSTARRYESSSALGSSASLAPGPIDFDRETVAMAPVIVAEHVVCNDRFLGRDLGDGSARSGDEAPEVDTSTRWVDANDVQVALQVASIGPLRVVDLRARNVRECPAQQGCGCDRQTAYRFFSVPRTTLPILVRVR